MRYLLRHLLLFAASISVGQAEPVNGWYAGVFGGYAGALSYGLGPVYTGTAYKPGYNIGGSIGLQNNAIRYAGELIYLDAKLRRFKVSGIEQSNVSGGTNATLALVNVYYDFNGLLPYTKPFIGAGIGYGWMNSSLNSIASGTNNLSNQGFAYQAGVGFDFNLSKKITASLGYHYISTTHGKGPAKPYVQASLIDLGLIYRFDSCLLLCK